MLGTPEIYPYSGQSCQCHFASRHQQRSLGNGVRAELVLPIDFWQFSIVIIIVAGIRHRGDRCTCGLPGRAGLCVGIMLTGLPEHPRGVQHLLQ